MDYSSAAASWRCIACILLMRNPYASAAPRLPARACARAPAWLVRRLRRLPDSEARLQLVAMPSIESPALLLVLTGSLLGLTFPLGKLASQALISPVVWAWLLSFGAGICLLLLRWISGRGIGLRPAFLRFYFLSALVSLVLPNLLIFSVIPRLGSGFTGILFTLSPLFTLGLSMAWRVRIPSRIGLLGIAIGFAGALLVSISRGEVAQPAGLLWLLAGLCIPVSLAVGNIYRTLAWPNGAQPMELAIGSNLAAAAVLLLVLLFTGQISALSALGTVPLLAVAQVVGSTAMFSLFFRLQQVGGPTYLSQIGYIGAAIALVAGTWLLDERYAWNTWFGALVILVGIILGVVAQRRPDDVPAQVAAWPLAAKAAEARSQRDAP